MCRSHSRIASTSRVLISIALALAVLPLGARVADAAEALTFRLSWIKGTSDAAVAYYAVDKGLFAAEGLDVTVREGQGSATNVKLIAAGDGFIGVADIGTAMKSIVKDVPAKVVFGTYQQNPMAVISLASKPIKTPEDLLGKKIVTLAAASYTKILPALCTKTGVDCKQISLLFANPPHPPYLLSGQADGYLDYYTDALPRLESMGQKGHALKYSTYGVNILSNGLIIRPETLEQKGDVVKRFLRAYARAWKAARDNPGEVVDVWLRVLGKGDRELHTAMLRNSAAILQTSHSQRKPLGWMAEEDWKNTQETLVGLGELEKSLPLDRYYTNAFVGDIK